MKLKQIPFIALLLIVAFQSCTVENPYAPITTPPTTVVATVTVPADIAITKGSAVAATNFVSTPAGATYTWTNSNTAIGLAASGTGDIPAFTADNAGTTAIIATITVTPTLNGTAGTPSSYTITVNPTILTPIVSTVTVPANIVITKGSSVAATSFVSTPAGATFAWTNSNTAIGLTASGSGNIPAFTATNTGTTAIIATITVTPTLNGTVGTPSSYTITVNATTPSATAPTVTVPANIAVNNNGTVAATNFISNPAGGTFTWTNSNTAIGLAASGSGNIPSFTAKNTGATALIATITVTPTVNGVIGTPSSYAITVNPTIATVTVPANITVANNGTVAATSFVSTPAGGTFTWTNSNANIGIAASGSGNIPSFTGVNTGTTALIATITVTPTVNGVKGTSSSYTITVNPTAPTAITLTGSASGLSKSHNAGQSCVNCHTPGGQASKFPWKIGGTIYTSAAGSTIASNLVVRFYTGPNGTGTLKYILNGDKLGNIYTQNTVDFTGGLYPAVVGPTGTKYMGSPVTASPTSCNSCHTGGTGTARIWAN